MLHREFYEAYRKYKVLMAKEKNRPDELYFKSKEYNAKRRKLNLFSRDFSDKLILVLNTLSNNHGRYWLLPVLWIFILGTIFFYQFLLNSNLNNESVTFVNIFKTNYHHYFQFLNPAHKIDLLGDNVGLNKNAYVWDWGFRIISAYLIFQTVVAFRKYKE